MSALVQPIYGFAKFECPIDGCGFMVSGNFGQETQDAIEHLNEEAESATHDGRDDDLAALIADAAVLGYEPSDRQNGSEKR